MTSGQSAGDQNAQVNVTPGDLMDEARQLSIATALRDYRDTVLQQNLAMLRILVNGMADQQDKRLTPKDAARFRLKAFSEDYLARSLPQSVKEVRDLLSDDVRDELISKFWLEGVSPQSVNAQLKTQWYARVQARMEAKGLSIPVTSFPPSDLKYLCTLVNEITGPGLIYHRAIDQIDLIDEESERHAQIFNGGPFGAWDDWEIAVACKLGSGTRGSSGSVVAYCRKTTAGLNWQWRYGSFADGWGTDLFDTVEEFLAFHAHFGEQTEEQVKQDVKPLIILPQNVP